MINFQDGSRNTEIPQAFRGHKGVVLSYITHSVLNLHEITLSLNSRAESVVAITGIETYLLKYRDHF